MINRYNRPIGDKTTFQCCYCSHERYSHLDDPLVLETESFDTLIYLSLSSTT